MRLDDVAHKRSAVTCQEPIVRIYTQCHRTPIFLETAIIVGSGGPSPSEYPRLVPGLVGGAFRIMSEHGFPSTNVAFLVIGLAVPSVLFGSRGSVKHRRTDQRIASHRPHPKSA